MSNVIGNIGGDFQLDTTENKFYGRVAKVMSTVKTIDNFSNIPSGVFNRIHFRIYHGTSNMIIKDYYLYANGSEVKLVDLEPKSAGNCYCFLALNENKVTVYFKPCLTYARTIVQVVHCLTPGMFEFHRFSKFDTVQTDIENQIQAISNTKVEEIPFTYANNWQNYSLSQKTTIQKRDREIVINLYISSGTISNVIESGEENIVFTIDREDARPETTIVQPTVTWNGGDSEKLEGFIKVFPDGKVKMFNAEWNHRITASIKYYAKEV